MPWKETVALNERMKFVMECELGEETMSALCVAYGVSRRVGYKWLGRYSECGVEGLRDQSRAPQHHPNALSEAVEEAVLALRVAHPTWGPRKLLAVLERDRPGPGPRPRKGWPAASTIGALLARRGLSVPRKRRRRVAPGAGAKPFADYLLPNDLWCIDFKGWFITGDGSRCDPLTLSDASSRYILRCQAMKETSGRAVRPVLEAAFREYGLPRAIRSDNGSPFASRAVAGLSPLSVWWMKLGIVHERITPGCPQENGRHERMHLTLKKETASPPAANPRRQQERFDAFGREFNEDRPHEALGMATPDSCYERSEREYPARLAEVEYPEATAQGGWLVRRVQKAGEFYWKHEKVFMSEVLGDEPIGLEPVDDRYWRAWFGAVSLGVFDSHKREMLIGTDARRWERRHAAPPVEPPSATLQGAPPANTKVLPMSQV